MKQVILICIILLFSCQSNQDNSENDLAKSTKLSLKLSNPPNEVAYLVASIEHVVTSTSYIDTIVVDSNSATIEFASIEQGDWNLAVSAYNDVDVEIYEGSTVVTINLGITTEANLQLNPINGSIIIDIIWGGENVLQFDGINDLALVSNSVNNDLDVQDFTIEVWVYRQSHIEDIYPRIILGKKDPSTNGQDVALGYRLLVLYSGHSYGSYKPAIVLGDGNVREDFFPTSSLDIIPLDEWVHVAFVYNAENHTGFFILNGVLVPTTKDDQGDNLGDIDSLSNSYDFQIGGDTNIVLQNNFFSGLISDLRIWKIGRTESEIIINMNNRLSGNEVNLSTYFQLNEGSSQFLLNKVDGSTGTLGADNLTSSDDPVWTNFSLPIE